MRRNPHSSPKHATLAEAIRYIKEDPDAPYHAVRALPRRWDTLYVRGILRLIDAYPANMLMPIRDYFNWLGWTVMEKNGFLTDEMMDEEKFPPTGTQSLETTCTCTRGGPGY